MLPQKRGAGKIAGLGCAGIVALFVIVAVATGGGSSESKDSSEKDRAVAADGKPGGGGDSGAEPADEKSQAEQFTDYTGGIVGPHQGEGKLIASAFTSCYESENGLVTVYDKDGELLANANY
ncbi:hypothetical protein [Streptomyces sp. NPDC057002]|uniref:hypothetical protein n=1 Tax=Streptomyces sp. NPDC057002 TaxID=3345992 RepID=UPI00363D736A